MKSNHVGGLKRSLQKRNDSKINKREKEKEMTTGGLSPLLLSSVDIVIISLKEKLSRQV